MSKEPNKYLARTTEGKMVYCDKVTGVIYKIKGYYERTDEVLEDAVFERWATSFDV